MKDNEDEGNQGAKSKNKRRGKDAGDRAQYVAAALRFEPHEYFKRLVTHHNVSVYIRLLDLYAENPAYVNHYIFIFLQVVNLISK